MVQGNKAKNLEGDALYGDFSNYELPDYEQGHYHVVVEGKNFSQQTGARISKPYVQKYTIEAWRAIQSGPGSLGLTMNILHDPTFDGQKDVEDKTVVEIKAKLDEFGIEYKANEKKDSLVKKLEDAEAKVNG